MLAIGAVATAAVFSTATARATFNYFDPATPITVPATQSGFFFDVMTGDSGIGAGTVANPNIVIYSTVSGGISTLHFGVATGSGTGYEGASLNSPLNLDPGTYVGPGSAFFGGTGLGAAFHQNGTELAGFEFTNFATNQTDYGWMHVSTTAGFGYPAAIVDWGYDDSGAAVYAGFVPEPASALSIAGLAVAAGVRRRRGP